VAALLAAIVEAYLVVGLVFALAVLPRRILRIDRGLVGAPVTVRLLLAPGTILLWPLLAWTWFGPRHPGGPS
jgi:hypothetical protein